MTLDLPRFVFAACQHGAEAALKDEVARRFPAWRVAFGRPGLVTFKLPPEDPQSLWERPVELVLARCWGFSLGVVEAQEPQQLLPAAGEAIERFGCTGLHVWSRDQQPPGQFDYEPGVTPEDIQAAESLRQGLAPRKLRTWVVPGTVVLDVMRVDPGQWLLGVHRATGCPTTRWPGGFSRVRLPEEAVSRAYLKMEEALRWSGLPLARGHVAAELGASPGGASQALLRRGVKVLGIDPAQIHPRVLEHPRFVHIRRRARYVPRRVYRGVQWLFADMNVTPRYTLDVVEDIVTRPDVSILGMLLTLKLTDWALADQCEDYLRRVRSWGFPLVRLRQLHHHRRELCLLGAVAPVEELTRRLRRRGRKRRRMPRRRRKAKAARDFSAGEESLG